MFFSVFLTQFNTCITCAFEKVLLTKHKMSLFFLEVAQFLQIHCPVACLQQNYNRKYRMFCHQKIFLNDIVKQLSTTVR